MNCWEYLQCGREPGGTRVGDRGVCPATTCAEANGLNGGHNGGRICWAVAGTFCGGKPRESLCEMRRSCMSCRFFDAVLREQGAEVTMSLPGQTTWVSAPRRGGKTP